MSNNITQITGNITGQVVFDVNSVKEGLTDDDIAGAQPSKERPTTAKWVKVTLITLIAVVAVLALSVCNYYWWHFRFDGDSAGILISALAVLVTFLVAWNIWQTIDAKNSIREFEIRTKDYETDLNAKAKAITDSLTENFEKKLDILKEDVAGKENMTYHHISAMLYDELRYYQLLYNRPQRKSYDFMEHSVEGLRYGIEHKDALICRVHITKMISRLRNSPKQFLTDGQVKVFVDKLNAMKPLDGLEKAHNALIRALQGWDVPHKQDPFDEDDESPLSISQ